MRKRLKRGKFNLIRAKMWLSSIKKVVKNLRRTSIVIGLTNLGVIVLGASLILFEDRQFCTTSKLLPFFVVMGAAAVRVMAMIRCAIEQQAAAIAVLGSSPDATVISDDLSRVQRRLKYKRWLWWTRFATIVTVVQFLSGMYLMFVVSGNTSSDCAIVSLSSNVWWKKYLLVVFLMMVCFVAVLQCFASSDVLRWRSFYDKHDTAWKAHYQEVFDHGIREALCCLGRVKYMNNLEEDEVNSVAQLLGDLVTYRATGTGHLEFFAGLALLQMHNQSPKLDVDSIDAPEDKIQEALALCPFAEAAYTGPLLDFGRNLILFPCVWLYRQGVLTAWSRNRRPLLEGDNWWRGHAAAFLNYVNLAHDSLRRGRVKQGKCQAAYFIVVLHNIRSVVIAVRGTETPEDLLTDGLCRETPLTMEDLDGLINGMHIDPTLRQTVLSSFPHYGHSGIVEAARELYHQIEGVYSGGSGLRALESSGFLSSLLGAGCECDGYAVRIVGHSLGGAIAALLGIRLYGHFSNLHVYAYGPLPCVDSTIAAACSGFITSIVHDSEFSSFLSVNSILRLRAAALTTLSQGTTADSAMIFKMAQLFLHVSKYQSGNASEPRSASNFAGNAAESCTPDQNYTTRLNNFSEGNYAVLHGGSHTIEHSISMEDNILENFTNSVPDGSSLNDPVSRFLEAVPSSGSQLPGDPPEVFLPGLIIHLIRRQRGFSFPLLKAWGSQEREPPYRAIVADRENFKEILISPSMFLDHLPWRCHYALQSVCESRKKETNQDNYLMV